MIRNDKNNNENNDKNFFLLRIEDRRIENTLKKLDTRTRANV